MDIDGDAAENSTDVEPLTSAKIQPLDPSVVNLIAAGEIIVAPVNALKELIENSVDAGSTSIHLDVLEGGLKMMQITDNGSGIDVNDLELLCVRHATSKIKSYDDLRTIATYGFRGEALASISHIAHVKVTTKTPDSSFAWTAKYNGSKLAGTPTKSAGNDGTRIMVEDLFYNIPSRRRAFRSPNEEFNKILEMVAKYAVHCWNVGFALKKLDSKGGSKMTIQVASNVKHLDRIRSIYGPSVAKELFKFSVEDQRYKFKANGFASNANYSVKRIQIILFINNRQVESTNIKKAIEQTYSAFLPKGGHPWAYLSIEIDPRNVDVNIHPTKREVAFLYEDEIIQIICEQLRANMAAVDSSRTFYTQTLLPGNSLSSATQNAGYMSTSTNYKITTNRKGTPRNDATLIRTDANARKITSMLQTAANTVNATPSQMEQPNAQNLPIEERVKVKYDHFDRKENLCNLSSIRRLRREVRESMHEAGTEVMASHTFVGILDSRKQLAIIQSGRKMYIVNYGMLAYDLFYQLGLTLFENFGAIKLSPPLHILPLMRAGIRRIKNSSLVLREDPEYDVDSLAEELTRDCLMPKREMLEEYWTMEITEVKPDGEISSLPLMLKGYNPSLARLPAFLVRLAQNVDWLHETECFRTFTHELARFYVPEPLDDSGRENSKDVCSLVDAGNSKKKPPIEQTSSDDDVGVAGDQGKLQELVKRRVEERRHHVLYAVEHVLFPAFKERLIVTNKFMENGIVEVADLKNLYRTFERC